MKIEISAELFSRLQQLAVPFIDTPESVIERAISCLEKQNAMPRVRNPVKSSPELKEKTPVKSFEFNSFDQLPTVKHTRPTKAIIDGIECTENTWNGLNHWVHTRAAVMIGIDELLLLSKANIARGIRDEKGFDYLPKVGCSIQRSDALTTIRQICHLAEALDFEMSILFEWKTHEQAQYPGQSASLVIRPQSEGIAK